MSIGAETANKVWLDLLWFIMENGVESSPRGMKIKELIGYQTVIDMAYPLVTIPGRNMGFKFAAAEAAWILSGDDKVATIAPFSRDISKFSDDGVKFFGAYGPKIREQGSYVLAKLREDPESRQAVINIWRESPPQSKDIPCSLSVQWLIRDNQLHCIYTMRASDAWLGWVYDVFNFSMLSSVLLLDLRQDELFENLELGDLTLNAGSQHLYERDWVKAQKVLDAGNHHELYPPWHPEALSIPTGENLIESLWRAAKSDGALTLLRMRTALL